MMQKFMEISGDTNPLHLDEEYAQSRGYPGRVVYGILTTNMISRWGVTFQAGVGASSALATALIPRMASHFGMIVAHYHHSADDLFALKESVGCNFCLLQGDFTTESDTMRVMEEASACCDGFTHILDFEYNGAPCDCILEAP